ncbi:histone deacetylase [Massarina eburnea CBS 473.64]|uniref:Histone deacetylase n=1 Tax=Massarina eburnea CBS 473.64 TaxID=1395130 RepID=A0A6A6RUE1_9PLEO|nr:histone deacetylase [Massarina eburnea CBS 473.64]
MRAANYAMPTNGHSNAIVQEYLSPDDALFEQDFQTFKLLDDDDKRSVIQREAEEYGMEKPRGYNVSFHYNPHVEYHHFGSSHPMKPWRLTLTKQLVLAYGLEYCMELYEPRPATFDELAIFHDREYLSFLSNVTPQNAKPDDQAYLAFGFGGDSNDCPVFDGLWNYVSIYSGASMNAAYNLLNKQSDVAINWSGGLHHAKKNLASGFCYINDIVLAIQLLLTQNQRVLYIDIDVHHGDGVEAAFESTDRVFTLSYHKFGIDRNGYPFFPGTGNINEMGPTDPANRGKGHSLNIPIDDGIDDDQYKWLFKTVTGAVIDKYNPTAIVLQSGADSLGGDRLGRFNLNIKAHGFCVETVKNYGRPLLLIGGGGYTPRNVARTWCHETAVCVGAELHNDLPTHIPYIQAFQGTENGGGILYPDLHNTKRHENLNTDVKVRKLVEQAMENLRYLEGAPSVVVNTTGITEEQIMRMREKVDQELEEEAQEKEYHSVESTRRRKERNTGGRGERAMR